MSETNKPSAEQLAKFKQRANDMSLSEEVRAKFRAIVEKFEGAVEGEPAKPAKATRKPRATKEKATTTPAKRGRKPASTSEAKADAYEKAKADLKKKTGKTEEECEAIIDQYRELRAKAQTRKAKEEEASKENKKRVEKLERKGDIIEGTNEKTADAVIETATEEVADKIEKQIEAVEEKAEKEAKAEVAKDKTLKTPKAKKEAVEAKVEKKVAEKTKTIVKRVVIDTSALLTSIATTLGKFDKDSQKEFLIKLRSDIDKLLTKYAFGGLTDGANQVMNVTQSNLSSSSVNPSHFAKGGGVSSGNVKIRIDSINVDVYEDSYEEGEGKFVNSYTRTDFKGELVSPHQLIPILHEQVYLSNDPSDYSIYEGVIFTSQLITRNGDTASESEKERWKKGDLELFSENTNIKVSIVYPTKFTDEELSKLTGIGLYKKGGKVKISRKYAKGGGVRSYGKGGRMFGEDARLQFIDDAFASYELQDELRTKLGIDKNAYRLDDNVVISFAYTDYGGDFLDKVAIRYFEENYPENTLVENAGYGGQNAYVFGEPAQEWIDSTDDYPLGFENIEDLYYEMQNEAEYESFDMFLDDLERNDYVFDRDEVMNWLMENRGGYYSMTTQGLDFSYFDLADELIDEGLIKKEEEEYKKGGSIKDVIVYDNEGETFDRYTIFTPDGSVFGMSENATMPNGFNMYIGEDTEIKKGSHLGKRLKSVPQSIERAVMNRLNETYAKGGMTEHGLREGDRIIGETNDPKDSIYVVDSKKRGHIVDLDKGKRYDKGGAINYTKKWEVIGINRYGKKFKEIITLGRMSDKEDVKNALRRRSDLNISEVTSIKEVFAKGGGISAMLRNRRGK